MLDSKKEFIVKETLLALSNVTSGTPDMRKSVAENKVILDKIMDKLENCSSARILFEVILLLCNLASFPNTIQYLVEKKLLVLLNNSLKENIQPKTKYYILKLLNAIFELKKGIGREQNEYAYMFASIDGDSQIESLADSCQTQSIRELSEKIMDYYFRVSAFN